MGLRHEEKFWINWRQYQRLRVQVQSLLRKDPHTQSNGGYIVRSLYYETPRAEFAFEKLSGLMHRRKFRIRTYNRSSKRIVLEIKRKEPLITFLLIRKLVNIIRLMTVCLI